MSSRGRRELRRPARPSRTSWKPVGLHQHRISTPNEIVAAFLLALAVYFSWRADRRDRSQLASELAATKQLLAAADARQHDRDNQLAQTLAALAAEKRTILTPAQIVRELPSQIPLPPPIVLQSAPALPNSPSPQTKATIPAEDLEPLCKVCQAKLIARGGCILRCVGRAAKWFLTGAAAGAVAAKIAH